MGDTDVLVVGCGPVGVMAALRCVQRGLNVIAIDQSHEVYPLPRAIGMDDEVQDLFERAGLIEQLRKHSTPSRGGDFVDAAGERVVGHDIPPGTLGALGHPPMTMFDQPSVEAFLRQAAVDAGVDMRLSVEATALTSDDDGVSLTLGDGNTLRARWLIGADGAKSTIRDLIGISMIDQEFDQAWLVVDTTLLDPDLPLPSLPRQHCDPKRVVTFVPGHDTRRRWEFQLKEHETREQALSPDFLAELFEPWGNEEQLQIDRVAVYRFHGVVAERFREGPVFLAGDSAHQMPPFNGQGMCSGIRDAENLAWKLAAVGRGESGPALLDTYDAERRPHATSQVAHSVDAGKLIDAIAYDGERALESGYGRRKFPKLEHGVIETGEVHRLVGMPLPRPLDGSFTIGDGWTLLRGPEAEGAIPHLWTELGAVVHQLTPHSYGENFAPEVTVIVRPDRFVAAVTTDPEATTATFASLLAS
jgi:3-(3-hydroxy-phenyl)propionate hydroxylase